MRESRLQRELRPFVHKYILLAMRGSPRLEIGWVTALNVFIYPSMRTQVGVVKTIYHPSRGI